MSGACVTAKHALKELDKANVTLNPVVKHSISLVAFPVLAPKRACLWLAIMWLLCRRGQCKGARIVLTQTTLRSLLKLDSYIASATLTQMKHIAFIAQHISAQTPHCKRCATPTMWVPLPHCDSAYGLGAQNRSCTDV
jgi:hypothetical protein